jgi:hypothetical protein
VHRVIETEGLTRTFGGRVAVDHLDLAVERGTVFGLLGPNGAGKTTTIRMLTTLLVPTSGTARVSGLDVTRHGAEVRQRIGYVAQTVALQTNHLLTGRENVELEAALRHVPPHLCRTRTEEVLEVVGLLSHADRRIEEYSGGNRVPTHGTFFAISGFLTLPLVFMSSAFVPLSAMPPMAAVARLNPLTYAIEAMRLLVLDGWGVDVASSLGLLAAFAVGCLGLGTYEFRRHTGQRAH